MNKLISIVAMAGIILINSGCAVMMAAKQPDLKDTSVLTPGTPRSIVIGELGAPAHSEDTSEGFSDIFRYIQGYSQGVKAFRAVGHGVADVFTLGLWEVIGTPTESALSGEEQAVKVVYEGPEGNRKVKKIYWLKKK